MSTPVPPPPVPRPTQPPNLRGDSPLEPATATSARLPLVTAQPRRWTEAAALVAGAGAVCAGATWLLPGWAGLTWMVVAATILGAVWVSIAGWRTNRRRRLLADLSNRVAYLLKTPVQASAARWSRGLVGEPIKVRVDSSNQAVIGYGDRLPAQLAQAISRTLGGTFQVSRHDPRRGRTTLRAVSVQREKPTALELAQQRVRDVVTETFGSDATVDGFTTAPAAEDSITGFTVHYKAAASKLTVLAIRRRITNAVGDRLDGRWKADFALQDDQVTYTRRPPLPTFYARPTDPVPARADPAYNLIPQAVDEDGQILSWDISGVMAHLLRCGKTRSGKALELSTSIATPTGWTTMGDLKVGDLVFDDQGQPTTVTGVYDQPPHRPCFEVEFSDGSTIVADADHLWFTEDRAARLSRRAAVTHEPRRARVPRLAPGVIETLRRSAAAALPDRLNTLQEIAPLVGVSDTNPWLREIAERVGPAGSVAAQRSFNYPNQGFTQAKVVKVYPARQVWEVLSARAESPRHPGLRGHVLTVQQLCRSAQHADVLTARDLVRTLGVPYWQACRWLQECGVPHHEEISDIKLQVTAKVVVRKGRAARQYPRARLLNALADAGGRRISDQRVKRTAGRVRTTDEIRSTLKVRTGQLNHSVPVAQPLDLPERALPIPPYTLGAWLGDGHSHGAVITSADPEILDQIEREGYDAHVMHLKCDAYRACRSYTILGLRHQLSATGLLKRSRAQAPTKHIPPIYLRASREQRRALLAGLLDTDGTVSPQGTVHYTTMLPALADDVLELALSLGYRATSARGTARLNGRDCGPKWTIAFTTADPVFRLGRKRDRLAERTARHNHEKTRNRYIKAVSAVESRPMRCITVDSPSHLFLAGRSMIPTHNTVSLIGDAIEMARRGFRVLVLDPKRTEFLGLRDWPNVEIVATRVPDQVALVHQIWLEMEDRYRRIEESGADESDFDPILLIIDEYRQMHANVKAWWSGIKVTGMPSECPVFEEIGSLLRMAAACRIHVDLATQRPDAEFLKGEALAVDTPIPTPTGWTTMGEIEPGQHVLDEDGRPVLVTATTQVFTDRPCYRLTFSDGTQIVADEDHLWAARDAGRRATDTYPSEPMARDCRYPRHADLRARLELLPQGDWPVTVDELERELGEGRVPLLRRGLHDHRWSIKPLATLPSEQGRYPAQLYSREDLVQSLLGELISPIRTWRQSGPRIVTTKDIAQSLHTKQGHNWSIDTVPGLRLPEVELPIDPWLAGIWLGDGCRRAATIATADEEVLERIRGLGFRVTHYARYNYGISTGPRGGGRRPSLQGSLRQSGLLFNKHIPQAYLRASDAQRADLLAGLLDSDGSCSLRGRGGYRLSAQVTFTNTNPLLIEGVRELAASFGFLPTVRQIRRAGVEQAPTSVVFGRPIRDAWAVSFTPDRQVFGLRRKQQILEKALATSTRTTRRPTYVIDAEPVPSVPVRCITVDSPTHLYLAGRGFIATHNCRDNFAARAAAGRLSPDGAQMMFDSPHVGVTIPLNVRGRGTMTGMDDRPREVQFLYTPDPRRARTPEDVALLNALRPPTTRWPRKTIQLPPAAEVAEALDGKKTSLEWEQVLRASLAPFNPSTSAENDDAGYELDIGRGERIGRGTDDPRNTWRDDDDRGDVDDLTDVDDQGDLDDLDGYDAPCLVRVEDVVAGDLIRLHDRGPWVCVELVDQVGPAYGGQVQLDWRDDDANVGEQLVGAGELIDVRRPFD